VKKHGLLHPQLIAVVAALGHGDGLLICDAAYPVPPGVPRIDLGYRPNDPRMLDVLESVASELCIEAATIATEMQDELQGRVSGLLGLPLESIAHAEFLARSAHCRAAVVTGEFTPFANVIVAGGVAFA
jgi:D-ribose pyranase